MNENEISELVRRSQKEKVDKLMFLNQYAKKGQILFTGSSLMEQFPVDELLINCGLNIVIYNRGVSGFTTTDMLENMTEMVFAVEPSKIFINIGSNDIAAVNFTSEHLIENYEKILTQIKIILPQTKIYVMAYYPVNEVDKLSGNDEGGLAFKNRNNKTIGKVNLEIEQMSKRLYCRFINVNSGLTDCQGRLKKEYTIEGIHMYANAYHKILQNMLPYIV